MGVPQGGQVLPLLGEGRQGVDGVGQAQGHQLKRFAEDDQVGVAADVLRGRPEMDDPLGGRGDLLKGMHVRHHIMAQPLLPLGRPVEVDVVELGLHLLHGFIADAREPQFLLAAGQFQP